MLFRSLRLSDRGVGRVRRLLSEKRWQWFGAFDGTLADREVEGVGVAEHHRARW